MQSQGKRGVSGEPHWLVERDVRRRTELSKPGPGTVMGAAENALMIDLSSKAKKGGAIAWAQQHRRHSTCQQLDIDLRRSSGYWMCLEAVACHSA